MASPRPYVLTIAGLDPSGGAGLLADIKTIEANKAYGLGVASALTWQNDSEVTKVEAVSLETIKGQVDLLLKKHTFEWVKIGLVTSLDMLGELLAFLSSVRKDVKVVWDPVLVASSGFVFHKDVTTEQLDRICSKIYLITPNVNEAAALGNGSVEDNVRALATRCNVLLKGGHKQDQKGTDQLWTQGGKQFNIKPRTAVKYEKHGSGCVLSSAITARLSRGFPLLRACLEGKEYTEHFLNSNPSLLGFHKS